ncbi:MAG: ribose transport system permease protein [Candidatus Atribacteria bacterium]|nr:ribose transport system permease protein [Candidatus Atribacteria bacterium]
MADPQLETKEEKERQPTLGTKIFRNQLITLIFILLAMVLFLGITTSTFLTATNIFNVLRAFSWIAIAAFGQSMVIIGGGIDLSSGSNMAFCGIVAAALLVAGYSVTLAVVIALVVGAAIGFLNGFMVSRTYLPPFIATLGMMSIIRGFCYGLTNGWPIRGLPQSFLFLGQTDISFLAWKIPLPAIIMVVFAILSFILLEKTKLGYHVYAVGGNEYAASLSGISCGRVKLVVFTLSGLFAGLGGILMTSRLGVAAPTAASGYELDIIAAAVIGGVSLNGGEGSVWGALIGAALMQILRNALVLLGFPAYWQPSAIGAVIIGAVMIDQYRKRRF